MMERPREHAHRRFEDMAVSHVLGGLNSNDGRMFRSHLIDCQVCRARVGELRAIAHDLADVERDERRTAERRRVETKPVEIDVDHGRSDDAEPPRRWFLFAVGGLLILIGLLSWNFVLRSNNTRLEELSDHVETAALSTHFGEEWHVTYPQASSGVRGAVSSSSGGITLLIDNAEDTHHRLHFFDESGVETGDAWSLTPEDGRWLGSVDRTPADAVRVELRRSGAATDGPAGMVVLEARKVGG